MRRIFALVLATTLVGGPVSASDDAPVSLKLICPGAEETDDIARIKGDEQLGSAWVMSEGIRRGNLKVTIEGERGVLDFPSGAKKSFQVVEMDERHILGKYKELVFTKTVKIDRMTGDVRIKETFGGTCAAVPVTTTPKF